jgi:hypothetical protein
VWLGVGAAVIAAIVILVVVATGAPRQDDASSPGSTSSASPAPTPAPGTSPTDEGTADPTTPPDASAPPAADPGQPAQPPAQDPVGLTEPAAPVPGVTFSISGLEAVDGVANGPGEVAGPALRFTLSVRNDTAEAVSLVATVVNVFAGADRAPAAELGEPGGVPLPETVAPGETATGVFVFNVPTDQRDQVQISVDYSVDAPIVLFEGAAPR